jgi:hypothetical protein
MKISKIFILRTLKIDIDETVKNIIKAAEKDGFEIDKQNPIKNTEIKDGRLCYMLNAKPKLINVDFTIQLPPVDPLVF